MVYIHSWQEFQDAAEALYAKSPNKTRYCVKWKASEGKLVLKITDNATCLKFKTYSSIFLNRFETLNLTLMMKMQNRQRRDEPSAPVVVAAPTGSDLNRTDSPAPVPSSSIVQSAPLKSGGVKKKKPKKK